MEIAQKIKELAESKLKDPAHFVVDVLTSKHKPLKITIILDGDRGITIDDCSEISRQVSADLDSMDLVPENFTLEVGTPGLDQPLKLKRQYVKNKGREVRVHRKDKTMVQGKLKEAGEETIVLETEEKNKDTRKKELKSTEINFNEIEKTLVMISFK